MVKYIFFWFYCSIIVGILSQQLGSLTPVDAECSSTLKIRSSPFFWSFLTYFMLGRLLQQTFCKLTDELKQAKKLFIPECMIQIGFKGMFFLWNFASFLPSTLLHLTLFRAWSKGNIGITREEERANKKKIKK